MNVSSQHVLGIVFSVWIVSDWLAMDVTCACARFDVFELVDALFFEVIVIV